MSLVSTGLIPISVRVSPRAEAEGRPILLAVHSEPWWLITRITGIAAMVGLMAVAVYGVLLAMRLGKYRPSIKRRLHRRLSRLVLVVLGVHIGGALLDAHHIPPEAVLVPFVSPVRTYAAGLGSLALWSLMLGS